MQEKDLRPAEREPDKEADDTVEGKVTEEVNKPKDPSKQPFGAAIL